MWHLFRGIIIPKEGGAMKMPLEIDTQMFAPCGMNCMVCYKHCYTKRTRSPCSGCIADGTGKPKHCRDCKIKSCTIGKGITYCFDCMDFPCKLIKNLEKSYNKRYEESLIESSIIAKTQGIEHLMRLHNEKYRCPQCGGILSLHDKVCSECEKKV